MCFRTTSFRLTLVTLVYSAAAGLIKVGHDVQLNVTGSFSPIGLADPSNVSVQRPVFAMSLKIDLDDPYYCVVMIDDCEQKFATQKNRLDHCTAEIKTMEAGAQETFDELDEEIAYNECRKKELYAEWQRVTGDFSKDNPYLQPSFGAHMLTATKRKKGNLRPRRPRSLLVDPSNISESQKPNNNHTLSATQQSPPPIDDPVNDDYYYGDQGPVPDPECVCVQGIDHCECVPNCRNLCDQCKIQYKGTKDRLTQKWENKNAQIQRQEGAIYSLEENIRRARIEDPQKNYDREGAIMKDKARVSQCGGKPHVVR